MSKLYIPILEGTRRVKRKSIIVARYVHSIAAQFEDIETELLDPNDFNFTGDGNDPEGKDPRYTAITKRMDGLIIVTPEYNHSFPGSLKRMLDSELKNYIHKPVGFVGVSDGRMGGVRAIESLVNTVREMGLVATFSDTCVPLIDTTFKPDGQPAEDWIEGSIRATITEVIWMAKTLKWGRDNESSKYHQAE